MLFLNQNIFAEPLQYRPSAISSDPVNKQLGNHPADDAEEYGAHKIDVTPMNEISSVSKHDLTWNDLDHKAEHNAEIPQLLNPLE
ncbi:hypothetical protein D3C73_1453270 [compost metagenome]